MKSVMHGAARGEIPEPASRPLSPISDGVAGRAVEQSSGLTHWDPVKSQWNLTCRGRGVNPDVVLSSVVRWRLANTYLSGVS